MTEQQKDILIAKMLDAPASLSDEELDMVLLDEELRDIYEASALVSDALSAPQEFDVEQEWRLFRHRIMPKPSLTRRFMRVAVIFLGVVIASGIIAKVIDYSFTRGAQEQIAEVAKPTTLNNHDAREETPKVSYVEPATTPKESREAPAPFVVSVPIKNDEDKSQEEDIDVDEYLRLQQARIDNDLAMMTAESYLYEYNEILQDIDGIETYDKSELEISIRQLTIQ